MEKVLILYATHEINRNMLYFYRNGYIDNPKYDFYFIINNDTDVIFDKNKSNIKIIKRENWGLDFGAWSYALFLKENNNELYKQYKYFIFINSTVRGPFLPSWYDQNKHNYWPDLFINKLDENVKLVGPSIGFHSHSPYISSSIFATDIVGLNLAINNGIFNISKTMSKDYIIEQCEIKLSRIIIDANFNIKCFLKYYDNIDLKEFKLRDNCVFCHQKNNHYYGININPYEVIFMKENRNIDSKLLNLYSEWNDNLSSNNIKLFYGTSKFKILNVTGEQLIKFNIKLINKRILSLYYEKYLPYEDNNLFIHMDDNCVVINRFNIDNINIILS